ncbi:MAG: hypothetical protein GWN71_21810 [Gammaproteobacteria bacterium]|nr:hypothetical protein [Gammaproteobacteria bacterium]
MWEIYAASGAPGSRDPAKIVFHCLTDMTRRARFLAREGDRSDVERDLVRLSDSELRALLEASQPLS